MMTPQTLRSYGEALFGPRWQTDLARAIDVSDRTMRRWVAGSHEIPARVADEIAQLAAAKAKALIELPPP